MTAPQCTAPGTSCTLSTWKSSVDFAERNSFDQTQLRYFSVAHSSLDAEQSTRRPAREDHDGRDSQEPGRDGGRRELSQSQHDGEEEPELELLLRDERLPCAEHLDPDGTMLPTSDWIHINGTLPIGSLNQLLTSLEQILMEEEQKGIIDLDAEWNPVQDATVPLMSFDQLVAQEDPPRPLIEAAHVVISPFGRPNGWHVKLANRSLAYAILSRGQQQNIRIGWKLVQVSEYHYSKERQQKEDPAWADNGLIVDDSMVRIENCPPEMNFNYVRYLFSRFELAHEGTTILTWKGKTDDGKVAPLMYIVRMESPSWARAAVRELQSTVVNRKIIKLVQFPQQIRYEEF